MHKSLFKGFAVPCVVNHVDSTTTTCRVVVARDVDEVDEFNQVVRRMDVGRFLSDEVEAKKRDILVIADGEYSGEYGIGKEIENNGFIFSRELTRRYD